MTLRTIEILVCLIFGFSFLTQATDLPEKRIYKTSLLKDSKELNFDGVPNESVWDQVEWGTGFTQLMPDDGAAPTRETAFKILYDESFLYVGYRAFHENPEEIVARMSRRDGFDGDWVEINIDSYFDQRTAFSFTTSVSGVKGDEFVSNDGNNWDSNWNPIWYVKTNIDDKGWTAEIKIPLSQLRFGKKDKQIWGFQVMRRDFGVDERSTWQHIPRSSSGWVSHFAELHGMDFIKPKRQVEIQPYIIASAENFEKENGNPFVDGSKSSIDFGVDGKIGVTSDLTLDFTINPDFGQVEADPSSLTLDGYQIFFSERRPFFVENNNLFDFRFSSLSAGGPFGNDNLFYSRRIGSSPRGSVELPDNAFSSYPDVTSILGAAKFSGKTKGGTGIAILESITAKEYVEIDVDGVRSEELVEPLSNYFIGRLTQDIKKGKTVIGGILTSTRRDLAGTNLEDQFHRDALTGGLDLLHTWKNKEWSLNANFVFSKITGSEEAIYETQTSFGHYFQRPDANHLDVDDQKTSLTGHGGTISLSNRGGSDNISFQTGLTWRSPELELNDVGFMNTADQIDHVVWVGYRFRNPVSIFRNLGFNFNHYLRWDFGGKNLYHGVNVNGHGQFNNYWSLGAGLTFEFKDISTKALFGGPALQQAHGIAPWFSLGTDNRKSVSFHANIFGFKGVKSDKDNVNVQSYSMGMTIRPSNAFNISIQPRYFQQDRLIQSIGSDEFNGMTRYLAGTVKQKTFSTSIRLNYNITPNLTVQYWGQPFISKGNYKEFKYITDPTAPNVYDRFHLYSSQELTWGESEELFYVDENLDGSTDYAFENPDFNFLQFRSNMVIRWEYTPGSELFLVWSQSNTNSGDPEKALFPSLEEDLFSNKAHNIFLLKWTYRFLR